jgi:hypothetical protein
LIEISHHNSIDGTRDLVHGLFAKGESMAVETIGEAWLRGWHITGRCAWGKRDGMKSVRPCIYSYDLDLTTLLWNARCALSAVRSRVASEVSALRITARRFGLSCSATCLYGSGSLRNPLSFALTATRSAIGPVAQLDRALVS